MEENWTLIDKIAYDLYSYYMKSIKAKEQVAEWWFKEYKDTQFKKYYNIAERKYKIKKIIDGRKSIY